VIALSELLLNLNTIESPRYICVQILFLFYPGMGIGDLRLDAGQLRVGVFIGLDGVKFEARRAKWRGPKGRERGWCSWGWGSQPPPHHLVWMSAVSSLSGVWGITKQFSCIFTACRNARIASLY